ncbi:MAG: neutral/alkaline non-lysosomal ceramidase N-terminal domain-containing protein [Pirellulales bacterium]|nr:neutral/alkaline non-lysosomal ceramidase N-terminal domain-containing protein [Pirellulales bacterium]
MNRLRISFVAFLSILAVLPAGAVVPAAEPSWKAGLARANITPAEPMWMAGYASRNRPAEGKLHDLWIKVLALEDAKGSRAVVVTSDLCGFSKINYDAIAAEVKKRCGLDRSQLKLTCSHTHSGPVFRDIAYDCYPLTAEQIARIDSYSLGLEKTIVDKIGEALANLRPATVWAGEGKAEFAVNRRNNRETDVAAIRQRGESLKGPNDFAVPVLAVKSAEGSLKGIVFGYACHATTLSINQWSGDYPGFTQIALEERHPEAVAMFYQGCGADQNPLPRRTVELCQQYGRKLAETVETVLAGPLRPMAPRLETAIELIDLPYGQQPTADELKPLAEKDTYQGRWAKRLLESLEKGEPLPKCYAEFPVQVWRLGDDQLWISLGGEAVVDYALMFKKAYGPRTWVNGYTNDVMSYVPSKRVLDEGGYEAGGFAACGLPANTWGPDIEERITSAVQGMVEKLAAANE